MNPEFIELTQRYDTYKLCTDVLIERLEGCIQQNPEVIATGKVVNLPNENPYEHLSAALMLFNTVLPFDRRASVQSMSMFASKLAFLQREFQLNARKSIRHLRRFFSVEFKELSDERTKLEKAREQMDAMKHQVITSNTTEKIEKFAVLYEQAVADFDVQAKRVIVLLNQLAIIKSAHLKDVVEFWMHLNKFNDESSKCIETQKI